jgi:hypothetical protein
MQHVQPYVDLPHARQPLEHTGRGEGTIEYNFVCVCCHVDAFYHMAAGVTHNVLPVAVLVVGACGVGSSSSSSSSGSSSYSVVTQTLMLGAARLLV